MRLKFLTSVADARGPSFDPGQEAEVPEPAARVYLTQGVAVEVVPTICPHCKKAIGDGLEAAALAPATERATLPAARKRG